jgi:hypothetical protein
LKFAIVLVFHYYWRGETTVQEDEMLKYGEGGRWWLGECSFALIGDALWRAANTARGAQDKANGELLRSGKGKGKKREGDRLGKLEINCCSQGAAG